MIPTGQFWQSSRGQIVRMMRFAEHTVSELAQRIRLTENAVRAHLVTLERDGLVRLSGQRPGTRRPNYTYQLTNQAEHLFPKAYAPVLEQILRAMQEHLPPEHQKRLIEQTGAALAAPYLPELEDLPFKQRVERVATILDKMGGSIALSQSDGITTFSGSGCPLSDVVHHADNSAACRIMQAMLSSMLGTAVEEHCQRCDRPRCCFRVPSPTPAPDLAHRPTD